MPRPLRVLMVCPQFRPMIGGYERAAERLAMALAERAHDVTVVAERRETSWAPREKLGRVALRRLRVVSRPGLHLVTGVVALAVYLLLHGRRFDVIHVHQYGWAAAVSITIGHLLRRPVVLKLTGTDENGIRNALQRGRLAGLLAGIHRRVDACLAPSERAAQEAAEFGISPERIHRIPNGIDTNQARPLAAESRAALRRRLGIGGDEVVALYVGRLSKEKNPLGLLEAWQQLGPPEGAVLVVAGDGPAREAAAARAAACGSSVRLLGFVTDPLEWYQLADLFVLPSIREGLSNSFLEALACGLPVVSTPVSGSEDIFASAEVGVLVERADVPSLARGIALLLADPARRARCAEAARRIAVDRFSLDHVVERVEALYRVLAASGPMLGKSPAR